ALSDDQRAPRRKRVDGHLLIAGFEHAAHRREELIDDGLLATMRALTEDAFHLHLPDGVVVKGGADLLQVTAAQSLEEIQVGLLVVIARLDHGDPLAASTSAK